MKKVVLGAACEAELRDALHELFKTKASLLTQNDECRVAARVGDVNIIYVPKASIGKDPAEVVTGIDKSSRNVVMLVYRNSFHAKNFIKFQRLGLKIGASVLPVNGPGQAAATIQRMQRAKSIIKANVSSRDNIDDKVLESTLKVPGISRKKASSILEEHKCIAAMLDMGILRHRDHTGVEIERMHVGANENITARFRYFDTNKDDHHSSIVKI
eukprot:jgi/Bigna1/89815/estExt_fgenesh1_pg.C_560031